MLTRFFYLFTLVSVLFFSLSLQSFAAISFTITPIKYDLQLNPGESITLAATIKNDSDSTVTLPTASSDFVSSGVGGVPEFVRKSELVYPDQQLSSWITISDPSITLAPGEEGSVDFTIDVPADATPGGHYGAVFFKRSGSETASGSIDTISIDVDYGILVIVEVSGDIIVGGSVGDPIISGGGPSPNTTENTQKTPSIPLDAWFIGVDETGEPLYQEKDNCPLGDFTTSSYDKKCFTSILSEKDNTNREPLLFENDFLINFSIPIDNTGNTHLKPTGKITLIDENGTIIKSIGEKNISSEDGVIIGKKVVDYIPINDEQGYILPKTERDFTSFWRGFPYKDYDDEGNPIIKYWNPSEYYTKKNKEDAGFLMPWQRVSEIRQNKTITAEIEVTYYDINGDPVVFNTAKEFPVQYIEQQVAFNPYIILALIILGAIIIMTWIAVRWWFFIIKTKKCWNCKEKIKSHWKTCPHCKSIQNKKLHKKLEKQSQEEKKVKKKSKTKKAPVKKKS